MTISQQDFQWVREMFSSGRAKILRLVTEHSLAECGAAVGISAEAWWKLEKGELITAYRAETLYPVLKQMENGERIDSQTSEKTRGE